MSDATFFLLASVSAVCILATTASKVELGDNFPAGLSFSLETAVSSLQSKSAQNRAKRYASEDCKEIISLASQRWIDCYAISLRYYSGSCRQMRLNVYKGLALCVDEATGEDLSNISTLYKGWRDLDI